MANLDIGRVGGPGRAAAQERQLQRTQGMLYASVVGSVFIVVVAALFLTLF